MISTEQLEKFKQLYRDKFGKEISNEDALEQATKLVGLMEMIYKPMTQENFDRVNRRRKELGGPPLPKPKLVKKLRAKFGNSEL